VALLLVLATGCGLPLPEGVQEPRRVEPGQQKRGDIQVLPPGPRDDNTPEQAVRGFFGAQSNPDDRHASARAFLTADRRAAWDDAGPVRVFDAQHGLSITAVEGRPEFFVVTGGRVGEIGRDGAYTRAEGTISITVRVRKGARGRWELSDAPPGLLLSTADRDRSFRWRSVYFLAPASGQPGATAHLVPDPVYFPVNADPAQALVERLIAGPSRPLGDSVETAVPTGTTLLHPVTTDAAGVVTVDLSGPVGRAPEPQLEQLSAQLVWTLRGVESGFSKLRLRSDGADVRVASGGDADGLQDRDAWASFDPDGLALSAPAYYLSGRRLRSLDPGLPSGPASDDKNRLLVDEAAIATRGGTLALLTNEGAAWALRTGLVTGTTFDVRWRGPAPASPSWGSGDRGVWFVAGGRVVLVPPSGRAVDVPVDGIGAFGPVGRLRVSRDGARVALVAGRGAQRVLVVGRVRVVRGQVRVVALRSVAPAVIDVSDVSWDGATSLVVLGRSAELSRLPIRVAVDGSTYAPLIRVGLENSEPVSLTGAPDRPLVVAATSARLPVLFRDNGRVYTREARGYAPFYPG
jgi:hypothetical protein